MVRMDPLFASWSNFFVITGSSAAALTGLMFVVLTLIAGQERKSGMRAGLETYTSPILVHFCAALLISAVLAAPWQSIEGPTIVLSLAGAYGAIYAARVMARLARFRSAGGYSADAEDWMWYGILPLVAYLAVFGGALSQRVGYSHVHLDPGRRRSLTPSRTPAHNARSVRHEKHRSYRRVMRFYFPPRSRAKLGLAGPFRHAGPDCGARTRDAARIPNR